jgi:mRNA-degrading endonuclease toxin of MazEF toxin-antitoxin module
MPKHFAPGEILLATLVFSSQTGAKKRPVIVVRDAGDDDLLVAPVTSQAARSTYDVILNHWQQAGLRLPSIVRLDKLATIEKATVLRNLGRPGEEDLARVKERLGGLCHEIITNWAARRP